MQKRAYIHAMLSYIEDHLSEDLKPESIAGGHFISVSQLYRDFYAFTGHSVKEYIRKRRISNACEKNQVFRAASHCYRGWKRISDDPGFL